MSEPNWLRKRCFMRREVKTEQVPAEPHLAKPAPVRLDELYVLMQAHVRRCNTIAILKQQCGVK